MVKFFNKMIQIFINFLVFIITVFIFFILYSLIMVKVFDNKYAAPMGFTCFEVASASMAPSINVKDLIEAIDANAFRLFMLSVHYRQPINYTEENIQLAVKEWQKIKSTFEQLHLKLDLAEALEVEGEVVPEIEDLMQQFTAALEDDFNTSNAITSLYGVIKEINKMTRAKASDAACKYALMTLQNMAYIFGFDLSKKRLTLEERELMKAWEEARKAKDFTKADELRAQLQALNVL